MTALVSREDQGAVVALAGREEQGRPWPSPAGRRRGSGGPHQSDASAGKYNSERKNNESDVLS